MVENSASSKARILVLEDNEGVRELTVTILKSVGYCVVEAENPKQVLEDGADADVDLIISDVIMPGMSGPEFSVIWLKNHPEVKFLFMSGFFEDDHIENILNADNLIRKPFKAADLISRVEKVLGDM